MVADSPSPEMSASNIFGQLAAGRAAKKSSSQMLLIKYLRVACLALSLMSLVFSATSYSTNRWSVSANDLAVDKFNLPLTFADRHTKDAECRSKICRVLDERKDALLIGRIYRGLTSVCEMVTRRTGETLVLTCARTDDNFIDVNVIRRLQLSAVVISTFNILLAGWLLVISLHRPTYSSKQRVCARNPRKLPIVKIGECTLVLQITSIVFYLLCGLLLAMGSIMYVSNKQPEEVISYSFFFTTVAFSCHLIAALAAGSDFFICASLNNRTHGSGPSSLGSDYGHLGGTGIDTSSNSSGVGTSNFSTLGINFRPIAFGKPSNTPPAQQASAPQNQNGNQQHQQSAQNNQQQSGGDPRGSAVFEPPSFMTCMRYHD